MVSVLSRLAKRSPPVQTPTTTSTARR
jgi:hypothetical protein